MTTDKKMTYEELERFCKQLEEENKYMYSVITNFEIEIKKMKSNISNGNI